MKPRFLITAFFFHTMGESKMGAYAFSSWTLHMASIIIFGTLWGFAFGLGALVLATVVIGAEQLFERPFT